MHLLFLLNKATTQVQCFYNCLVFCFSVVTSHRMKNNNDCLFQTTILPLLLQYVYVDVHTITLQFACIKYGQYQIACTIRNRPYPYMHLYVWVRSIWWQTKVTDLVRESRLLHIFREGRLQSRFPILLRWQKQLSRHQTPSQTVCLPISIQLLLSAFGAV